MLQDSVSAAPTPTPSTPPLPTAASPPVCCPTAKDAKLAASHASNVSQAIRCTVGTGVASQPKSKTASESTTGGTTNSNVNPANRATVPLLTSCSAWHRPVPLSLTV
jgi:hypothetical protein